MEEKLNQLITKVEVLTTKVEALITDKCKLHQKFLDDHEDRIRILEENKNQSNGKEKIYQVIIGLVIAIITGVIVKVI